MIIQNATTKDIPALMRLYHFLDETYTDNLGALMAALNHPTTHLSVLIEDEKIVATGTLSLRVVPSMGLVGFIDDVVVDPEYRGRGFGRAISESCVQSARNHKCIRVELTSRAIRVEANALYKSMGFVPRETNLYVVLLV